MSKYRDQIDSSNVICPYCKYEYQAECEDYSEDEIEEECGGCGMKFYLHHSFNVDHHTNPDCELNGYDHKWEPLKLRDDTTHDFCSVCEKCRPIDS